MARLITLRDANATEFVKVYQKLMRTRSAWEVWADFVSMFAIAISNTVDKENYEAREKECLHIVSQYSADEIESIVELIGITTMALEGNMWQDFLGSIYMALDLGSHWKGQFFTPYTVTKAMAELNCGNIYEIVLDKGYITANDCACGAGATLIAVAEIACWELSVKHDLNWQNHVLFTAQDIDPITAKMCYIQLSLLGCSGFVKIGDSLLCPMCADDNTNNYWFTPMYFSEVWQFRRVCHVLDKQFEKIKVLQKIKPKKAVKQDESDDLQLRLF